MLVQSAVSAKAATCSVTTPLVPVTGSALDLQCVRYKSTDPSPIFGPSELREILLPSNDREIKFYKRMGHRYLSNQFTRSGLEQYQNNQPLAEQPCIPMARAFPAEDEPFVASMDHTIRGGVHLNSHWDLGGRSNEHHSSYVSMEVQCLPPPYSRSAVDPYTHSSTNGNMPLAPTGPVGPIHSSHYNVPGTGDITAGNGGPYKRKNPGISEVSSNSFYGEGSSSSSQMLIENPAVNRLNLPPYMGSSLSIDSQDSFRNVRSRSRQELEPCMTRASVPSYASHYCQPTPPSVNYSVPVHPLNLSTDVTSREWNSASHHVSSDGSNLPPDINGQRHGTSQFYAGGSSVDINAYHHDPFSRRNLLVSSSQHPHVSHAQPSRDEHNYHSRRVAPLYRNGSSYYNYTHGDSSSSNELHFPFEKFSSRHSRHLPPGGWGGDYRSERPRIAVDERVRLQPIVDVMDSHDDGFGYETSTVDQSSFHHPSRNFPDQYQHMRLDIDNMSYEELLALEESIGDVSTGLSEDGISKCLRENVYYSMDQNYEEATCPICLEEYKNGEKVGRMEKCGHEYHADCIKKWLLMKKVCPICKCESSTQ